MIQTRPFEGKSPSSKVCSFRENIFTYWSIYWTDIAEGFIVNLFTSRVDFLMAAKKKPKKRQQYSKNELEQAIEKVSEGEMSLRQAEGAFGVPKSTLSDHR